MLIAYAKIAGSLVIGKNVMIAEDVGITDHVTIGDNCIVGGGSNVYKKFRTRFCRGVLRPSLSMKKNASRY